MQKLSGYRKKSIPPFYFSHVEWSYNRNVQEINEYEYK